MLLPDEEDEEDEEEDGGRERSHRRRKAGAANSHNLHPHPTDDAQHNNHHPIKTVSLHTLYELAINHVANNNHNNNNNNPTNQSSGSPTHSAHPSSGSPLQVGSPLLETEVKIGLGQLKLRYQRLLQGVGSFRSFDLDEEEAVPLQARAS